MKTDEDAGERYTHVPLTYKHNINKPHLECLIMIWKVRDSKRTDISNPTVKKLSESGI